MNVKIAAAEQVREAQFTILKESIKRLVFSLENRNQSSFQQQSLLNVLMKAQSKYLGLSDQNTSK